MKILLSVVVFIFFFVEGTSGQIKTDSLAPFCIGEVRVIKSKILNENRTLNIYLPQGFHKDSIYPVLYLLDGSAHEDFLHIVGLVQFFNLQLAMPDFIVVGVANVDRKRDFTFKTKRKDLKELFPSCGGSAKFIEFVEKELQPYIEACFNTNDTRYLIGQSLGGLLASEILLKKSYLFSHYFIVSPSLWWDNESMLNHADKLLAKQKKFNCHVYIAVGGQEDEIMIREAKALAEVLKNAGTFGLLIDYNELAEENHASILHQSINDAFEILFPF